MSFIWSIGQATKELMRNPHRFSLLNLEMLLKLSLTSTLCTQLNLDHGHLRLNFLFSFTHGHFHKLKFYFHFYLHSTHSIPHIIKKKKRKKDTHFFQVKIHLLFSVYLHSDSIFHFCSHKEKIPEKTIKFLYISV